MLGTVVVVVVVVVVGTVVVVVVGGGDVVVVVVGGGDVVVVVVGELPPLGGDDAFGVKVHMAAAQSWGWAAATTSTPGSELKRQTLSGGPPSRQVSAGSSVVTEVRVPRYWAEPSVAGVASGVSDTDALFQTPVVV
ncbi:MAG TPA: hypothetical protein VMQ59_05525 [Acidimicrobiales bacterium]|nr:hypothetical protein [Acidimicrobiales bacterium]